MTLQDQLIEGSGKYMGESSSKYVTTLVSLVNKGTMISGDIMFLICDMGSCKHIFKGLYEFMVGIPSGTVTRGNSKHFLPQVNGGNKLNLELSFKTKSHSDIFLVLISI